MKIALTDDFASWQNLLPLTYTRPTALLRVGITTIADKWRRALPDATISVVPAVDYLKPKFGVDAPADAIAIPGNALPTPEWVECLKRGGQPDPATCRRVKEVYDIFGLNGEMIAADFHTLTQGRQSADPDPSCRIIGPRENLFIEAGASVVDATLNVSAGPIYIGRDAVVMEGSLLRGPVAICEHATVNMGTKIYPGTTIGPWCKVGGELNNVVMLGYSNKAHDGFLGNAVIGEWCNLGAGCVASNLKNDYTEIKLWNYPAHRFLRTGLQFCGLIMGDHSKAGINTMFNTATVVGVGVNIHGSGFPRNFVASFQEGGAAGFTEVSMQKFYDIARRVMARRGLELTPTDIAIFEAVRSIADEYK